VGPTTVCPLRGWSIFQPGLDCLVQRPVPLVADVLHLSRVFVHLLGRLPPEVATVNFRFVVAILSIVVLVHREKQNPPRPFIRDWLFSQPSPFALLLLFPDDCFCLWRFRGERKHMYIGEAFYRVASLFGRRTQPASFIVRCSTSRPRHQSGCHLQAPVDSALHALLSSAASIFAVPRSDTPIAGHDKRFLITYLLVNIDVNWKMRQLRWTRGRPMPRQSSSALVATPVPSLKSLNLSAAVLWRFYCWYVTSRCDLDLWSWTSVMHRLYLLKLCTKFEWNRAIRSRVIAISLFDLMTLNVFHVLNHTKLKLS